MHNTYVYSHKMTQLFQVIGLVSGDYRSLLRDVACSP